MGTVRAIPCVAGFHRRLGVVLGDWATISGFLRKDRGRLPIIGYSLFLALMLGAVLYSRFAHVFGAPTTYLYLEVGGSLLCFCYAANALVRFRGTHDRIALILAFGFVLSDVASTQPRDGRRFVRGSGRCIHHQRCFHCGASHPHSEIRSILFPPLGDAPWRPVRFGGTFLLQALSGTTEE